MSKPIKPVFERIEQTDDFNCWLACIATIVGKSLAEVREVAEQRCGLPKRGPYWFSDEDRIAALFKAFGYAASTYKPVHSKTHLPTVCLLMVDYDPVAELGRHIVFVRDPSSKPAEYIIDPAYWISESEHVRVDWDDLTPEWYISVHPTLGGPAASQVAGPTTS